ncbi:MAG: hypothetical protein MJZ30_10180 [Paludibacteraceae bacterium]|nr:hypothetical protein [Paludibacteraceae bacterium]
MQRDVRGSTSSRILYSVERCTDVRAVGCYTTQRDVQGCEQSHAIRCSEMYGDLQAVGYYTIAQRDVRNKSVEGWYMHEISDKQSHAIDVRAYALVVSTGCT